MAANNKITTIKIENKRGVLSNTNDWLVGVDYEDENENEGENINDNEQSAHEDDIKQYEIVDAEELAEITGVEYQKPIQICFKK